MTTTNMTIVSYQWNSNTGWEWDGCKWDADDLSSDGDFSAYSDGESVLLKAFDDEGNLLKSVECVVFDGIATKCRNVECPSTSLDRTP